MKVLLFGRSGQVATEIQRAIGSLSGKDAAQAVGAAPVANPAEAVTTLEVCGSDIADFTDPEACARIVADTDADVIVNAAAYTAVDAAEDDEATAHRINAETPTAIARVAAGRGIPLIHISTDYVFDGSGDAPWRVDDATGPLGAYGRTKLAGEDGIRAAGGVHAILRTSWVVSAHGKNFIKTMLRLGAERDHLTIVADQIGAPTPAAGIAGACLTIAERLVANPGLSGTYHFAGQPAVSWADFARTIFDRAGLDCTVTDIPTSDYPTPAARPLNSRLDCTTTQAAFALPQPDWRTGLDAILADLEAAR